MRGMKVSGNSSPTVEVFNSGMRDLTQHVITTGISSPLEISRCVTELQGLLLETYLQVHPMVR